jgi:hypothetical protein
MLHDRSAMTLTATVPASMNTVAAAVQFAHVDFYQQQPLPEKTRQGRTQWN